MIRILKDKVFLPHQLIMQITEERNQGIAMKEPAYTINCYYDDEAGVWTAVSEDIPGLVLEADSYDDLAARIRQTLPELFALNCVYSGREICIQSLNENRREIIRIDA